MAYSFSVKPEADSPEKLRAYAEALQINTQRWKLLTGDRKVIYQVGKDIFKADGSVGSQKSEDSFIHTQNIYLLDKQRRIRGIYDTNDGVAMQLLAKDIARLRDER
jgi:protein SCO1